MLHLDFESETPIYVQIAEEIEDAILSGAFPPESQVPSTTEISLSYKINPATVIMGINLLVDDYFIYKNRGLGMFVKDGAPQKIRTKRQEAFYQKFIVNLLGEAKKLEIGESEIIAMIERGMKDE